jgi:hypothetical protein
LAQLFGVSIGINQHALVVIRYLTPNSQVTRHAHHPRAHPDALNATAQAQPQVLSIL